jgi:hypothetical protein
MGSKGACAIVLKKSIVGALPVPFSPPLRSPKNFNRYYDEIYGLNEHS